MISSRESGGAVQELTGVRERLVEGSVNRLGWPYRGVIGSRWSLLA